MEILKCKSVIAFFVLVLAVSYISALDNVKVQKSDMRGKVISERKS